LEEAEDAYLSAEEGTLYLKNVLGLKYNTKNDPKNDPKVKAPNGNVHGASKTDEENWIPVIRHNCMHLNTEQRLPTVGIGGRAGQNWRSQPGLYNATCKKKKLTITTDKMEPKIKKPRPRSKPTDTSHETRQRQL
jgi:hypothetical protein